MYDMTRDMGHGIYIVVERGDGGYYMMDMA
jgi:hypothetical protein